MIGEARESIPMTLPKEIHTEMTIPQKRQAEHGTIKAMATKRTFTETYLTIETFTMFLRPAP